mmetsp:Transcript_22905/g.50303  ORF Transcript_22905/g.50303 Transcript_22905/m.50303 type:complete len:271 (+) Transcript_22905:146-958(+)
MDNSSTTVKNKRLILATLLRTDASHLDQNGSGASTRHTNAGLPPVENHIVLAHEHIPQDPKWSSGRRNIHGRQTENALVTTLLQNEVLGRKFIILPSQSECNGTVERLAIDNILTTHHSLCPQLRHNLQHLGSWPCQQRSARIHNCRGCFAYDITVELDPVQLDCPIGLRFQRNVLELTDIMRLVDSSDHQLPHSIVTKIKRKNRLVELPRIHQGMEWSLDPGNRNGIESQPTYTVKLAQTISKPQSACVINLGESKILDSVIANLHNII